jgi:hypothetical protein
MEAKDPRKQESAPVWQCAVEAKGFRLSWLGCLVLPLLGVTPVAYGLFDTDLGAAISISLGCGLAFAIWQEVS